MVVVCEVTATERSQAELQDEIAQLAAHISAGTCRWLELVAELDRRADWGGACTTAEWLAWRCALSPRAAREHVRVARALQELPLTQDAFARGELSYAKARALTRVAAAETEEELLQLARSLTAAQLDRAVGCYRRVSAADAKGLQATAFFGYRWDEDGALSFQGRLAPEDGALLLRALEAGRDALREREQEWDEERWERIERGPAGPHEPRYRPTNADALVAMADAALSASSSDHSSPERYQVVVHIDGDAPPAVEDGMSVATETAERISCDSSLVHIVERHGEPLSIGRKTRVVPSAMRRALKARDGGCRFPGCENRRFVDAHHLRHWAKGGETRLDNLVLLCRRHHQLVHEWGYSVERLGDGDLLFRFPWGGPIASVPRSPPGSADELLTDPRIGPWSCESGEGERMDLDLTLARPSAGTRLSSMYLGAHVSSSGGIHTAIDRIEEMGGESVQVFTQSPRTWRPTNHDPANFERFKERRAEAGIKGVVCHALYLTNLASPKDDIYENSVTALRNTVDVACGIGAEGVIFHVGSHQGAGFESGLDRVVPALLQCLERTTNDTWLLLENTAGTGDTIGRSIDELATIVDRLDRHPHIGICLDSCHLYASGYDVTDRSALDRLIEEVDAKVGLDRLRALHVNDSKTPLGSNRDRHDNIGEGLMGDKLGVFLSHPALQGLPAVLEVPGEDGHGPDKKQLQKLKRLHKKWMKK